jgi:predicted nucleic acid-binding Zn finger protein
LVELRVEVEKLYVDEHGILRALARIESERNPGKWYDVYVWLKDGEVVASHCTCPGYVFRGECKHVRWLKVVALAALGRVSKLQPG